MCPPSTVRLRCVTYCEVYVLKLTDTCRALKYFNAVGKLLHKKLDSRLNVARDMQNETFLKLKAKQERRSSVRWLKQQWRAITRDSRKKKSYDEDGKHINAAHTSQYLNLYVLSEEVELKVKVFCLKSRCPFVLDPYSNFRWLCDALILIAVILQSICLPYIIFFQKYFTIQQHGFFYLLDAFYVFGLYFRISTAIKFKGKLVSDVSEIIVYRAKQVTMLVDIVSTIPVEFICIFLECTYQTVAIMHVNRLCKIYRLFKLIKEFQLNIWIGYTTIRLLKYFLGFTFSIYILSCWSYGSTCFYTCDETGWYKYNLQLTKKLKRTPNATDLYSHPFMLSTSNTISMFLSLSNAIVFGYDVKDIITEFLITSFGYFIFSFCFSEFAACAVIQLKQKNTFYSYLNGVRYFNARRKVPERLKKHMYEVIQCQNQYGDQFESIRRSVIGSEGTFYHLPTFLRNEVVLKRIVDSLTLVEMFRDCDEQLLWNIAAACSVSVLPPGTCITREDTFCENVNVILRGYCKAESVIPTDKYHQHVTTMSPGSMFPVMETLMEIKTFLKVTSVTFVEIASVTHEDLLKALKQFPLFYGCLERSLGEHLEVHKVVLMRHKGKLPPMVSAVKSQGRGEFFTYTTNETFSEDPEKIAYMKEFKKLGNYIGLCSKFGRRN